MRIIRFLVLLLAATVIVSLNFGSAAPEPDPKAIERIWKSGETLPADIAAHFPNPPLKVSNDTGINVLVDLAHQCAFATMWGLPDKLHPMGFRCLVSHAALDTVLTPGKLSRMRVPIGRSEDQKRIRAFGWVPNPQFNVVITFQSDIDAQLYLPEERTALEQFVKNGGGLIIIDNGLGSTDKRRIQAWAKRSAATSFGVDFEKVVSGQSESLISSDWEVVSKNTSGKPTVARRVLGQGRLVLVTRFSEIDWNDKTDKSQASAKKTLLKEIVTWAASGTKPIGGEARFSQTMGGGGGIYPELEERLKGAVVYYSRNQKSNLLEAVRKELPKISDHLYAWLPSPVPEEPMFIILAAGGGGGWAVNAFYPKETGVISLDEVGLFGVFAHELGHTMSGPRNSKNQIAGDWFDGNQSEAHAGWWQGKILALYSGNKSMRDCNNLFKSDKTASEVDLGLPNREAYKKWSNGKVWQKLWWIWQKLDDRYGTTWYPRWRWVQYTRWHDEPGRKLSIDDMVEDMSIACGEDLFPFFKKIGTTLKHDRLEKITFDGQDLTLPIANLEVSPAGNAKHDPIGDYKKPLSRRP